MPGKLAGRDRVGDIDRKLDEVVTLGRVGDVERRLEPFKQRVDCVHAFSMPP